MNTDPTMSEQSPASAGATRPDGRLGEPVLPGLPQSLHPGSGTLAHGTLRVLVVDDHPVTRSGIRAAVKALPAVGAVVEAANGCQAIEAFRSARPHAVFMDDGMPRMNGWRATNQIIGEFPDARVVILSMRTDAANLQRACDCGALGYLLKTDPVAEFQRAFDEVLRGRVYISPTVSQRVARAAAARRKAALQKLRKL